ncbi:MAG: DUF4783 domain-containing protein [Bacteroidota bacterium]
MKSIFVLVVMLMVSANTQSQDIFGPAKAAIRSGNADDLAKQLNQSVGVEVNGKQATYSKAQAEMVLKDFFRDNPPSDFNVVHTGSSQDGALQFAIGKYTSGKSTFSVLIRIRTAGKVRLVHDISFVKE